MFELSNHKKHLKNVWAGKKTPLFTCSANSETSGWNLSWEQAWRIMEQVIIVFSQSEVPEISAPLANTMHYFPIGRELVFQSDFPLTQFHIWMLSTWREALQETWVEYSEGTSWMGVKYRIRLMKLVTQLAIASLKAKAMTIWFLYLSSGMMVPELMVL